MGNACCVASRDKMVVPNSSLVQTNYLRLSPTWSFRSDNKGRVAREETSFTCLSDGISPYNGSDFKFDSALEKSPASDLSFPRNSSTDTVFQQKANDSMESAAPSYSSPTQFSLSLASQPLSIPASPLSSQSYFNPASSSTLELTQRPSLSKKVSDGQIYGVNSLSRSSETEERQETALRYDSSQCSEMMSSSRGNRLLSYDNDCFGVQRGKIDHHDNKRSNYQQQTCGACSRPLSEKSLWSSQKILMTNELSVSAILACGHVYHGECLEQMTPEVDKFDPSCPICTLGEKKTAKLSEKALKVEMNLKARHNKRHRNQFLDTGFDCNDFEMFDHSYRAAEAGKSPKIISSSSVKSYSEKPFLARHFSFGSRGKSKSTKENDPVKKKGFFWTKSSKI